MNDQEQKIIQFPQHQIGNRRRKAITLDTILSQGNEYRIDLHDRIKSAKRIFLHPEVLAESIDDLRVSQYVLASLQDILDEIVTEITAAQRTNPEWAMELGEVIGEVQSCLSDLSETTELILAGSKLANRTLHSQLAVQSRNLLDSLSRLASTVEVIPFPISRYADGTQLPAFDSRSLP